MNGPKLWADMLTAINIPGAVVAGGCIRDYMLNVEPKDIDIFIPCEGSDEFNDRISKLSGVEGIAHLGIADEPDYESDDPVGHLYGVIEGELLGYPINIIARKVHEDGPMALIESFDFGYLQMYYAERSGIVPTAACICDRLNKRATMMHDRHVDQSFNRFLRFNNRHPGLLSLNMPYAFTAELVSVVPAENQLELIL